MNLGTIETYLEELTDYLCDKLSTKNYEILSSRLPGEKTAIVCVKHRGGLDCADIASTLEARRIIVSPRNDRLRIAPHFYNNTDDVDTLVAALPD